MKLTNPIGWCDETSNAVTGCDKVSPGCKNCYAQVGTRARVLRSQGIETWGPKGVRHPVAEFAKKIRRLNKLCICDKCAETSPVSMFGSGKCNGKPFGESGRFCDGRMRRIRLFADSNSDWLDEKWPIETLAAFLKEIHDAPNVDVLLLTKRPEIFWRRLSKVIEYHPKLEFAKEWILDHTPPANLWFGVSVEDQKRAEERIPRLLNIPARVRFLSVEPLLEKVDLAGEYARWLEGAKHVRLPMPMAEQIHWVIVGGESGKGRRDCGVVAIEDVVAQCILARVPVYCKQDCAFKSGQQGRIADPWWHRKEFPKV